MRTIKKNLQSSLLSLKEEEEARLVSRYLVEDNYEDTVLFNPDKEIEIVVLKSI
jgi:hypothetical protein